MSQHGEIVVQGTSFAQPGPDGGAPVAGELTPALIGTAAWSDHDVAAAGIPILDVPFVSIGGGIGSFVLVDCLRIAGIPVEQIRVLTDLDTPWQTYEYLTKVSQIPRPERLRSDSSGMPDNIWGFPSYALKEAWQDKHPNALWSVLVEPILTDYWTPRAGMVFEALERESNRIRYPETNVKGQVRMVRRRHGGGYFTILTPTPGTSATRRVAYRSRWVHLAIGYPGLRFLQDLQDYRTKYHDYGRVVNAYEPHEHVYEALRRKPGTVLVRGGGIVASRVLQRVMEDRWNFGARTTLLHLFRTYIDGAHGSGPFYRRKGGGGFAYQGFNWPKGSWGGQLKSKFEKLEGDDRKALYQKLGGTHTPKRKLWQQQMARARSENWYHTLHGVVQEVTQGAGNQVVTRVKGANGSAFDVAADYVIDATGLESDITNHRIFADLLQYSGVGRNVMGRLDCERTFEIRGARSEPGGRMYASGSATLGSYYAGVDSFLGLQYAALQITDDLAAQGFGARIGVARSFKQWLRWINNRSVDG